LPELDHQVLLLADVLRLEIFDFIKCLVIFKFQLFNNHATSLHFFLNGFEFLFDFNHFLLTLFLLLLELGSLFLGLLEGQRHLSLLLGLLLLNCFLLLATSY
jgi:hypothetical protein